LADDFFDHGPPDVDILASAALLICSTVIARISTPLNIIGFESDETHKL
jgi:hypothetical protein